MPPSPRNSSVSHQFPAPGSSSSLPLSHWNDRDSYRALPKRKLSPTGQKVLHWLEDAETCFPVEQPGELRERERILVSDLLRCASVRSTTDIRDGTKEFCRTHPYSCYGILVYLEPLVFARPNIKTRSRLGPWHIDVDNLILSDHWWKLISPGPIFGRPLIFRLVDDRVKDSPRTYIGTFQHQIVNEYSRWHLPRWFLKNDH